MKKYYVKQSQDQMFAVNILFGWLVFASAIIACHGLVPGCTHWRDKPFRGSVLYTCGQLIKSLITFVFHWSKIFINLWSTDRKCQIFGFSSKVLPASICGLPIKCFNAFVEYSSMLLWLKSEKSYVPISVWMCSRNQSRTNPAIPQFHTSNTLILHPLMTFNC